MKHAAAKALSRSALIGAVQAHPFVDHQVRAVRGDVAGVCVKDFKHGRRGTGFPLPKVWRTIKEHRARAA